MKLAINCRDRLTCTQELVLWCQRAKLEDVVLVDNASTYEPFVDWLFKECPYPVVHSDLNLGKLAPWLIDAVGLQDVYEPYAVTDCDIVPDESCPLDLLTVLEDLLTYHEEQPKIGVGLTLDDVGVEVYRHEQQFWQVCLKSETHLPDCYLSPVDTTLAVYRPIDKFTVGGLRADRPYVARHTSWYLDPTDLPEDERYYLEHMGDDTHWSMKLRDAYNYARMC